MDKSEAIKIAKRYADLIGNKYQIENVILFGSYAKGTNHVDSDIVGRTANFLRHCF